MGKKRKKNSQRYTSASEKRSCVLCGRTVYHFENEFIVGATGRVVCKDCLNVSHRVMDSHHHEVPHIPKMTANVPTPQEIIQKLDKVIIGQDHAKRAVAIALWKQLLRAEGNGNIPRTNLLLYGPTGCGKTALVREAAKIVDLPFIHFDATTLSEAGYRGRDAQDMVEDLMERFENHPKLSYGIVFLDEIDKLAARGGETRAEYCRGTQHSLLKLVEGADICHNDETLSTENILFIFGGAFTGLTAKQPYAQKKHIGFLRQDTVEPMNDSVITVSDFVQYGMEPELMGRVGQCIPLEGLSKEDLKRILRESELSPLKKYQEFFKGYGIQLEFSNKRLDELVEGALVRGTGARGLNNLMEAAMEPLLFKLAAGKLGKQALVKEETRYAG